jgi:2-iminobutanoate/2-iminopropanoate deaminase
MSNQQITPDGVAPPIAPYSWAIAARGLVFLAGHAGLDTNGELVGPGDIRAQTRQTMENLHATLLAAGVDFRHVVKTTVFLADVQDYGGMNEIYREYFPDPPPARSTVLTGFVVEGLLVEIEAIAVRPDSEQ